MNRNIARIVAGALLFSIAICQLASAKGPEDVVFEIARFEVSGNNLVPSSVVDAALSGYTGKNRDFDTISQAVDALERLFHERGFKLTTVGLPEQALNQKIVRLEVSQPTIGRLIVSGNAAFDDDNIRRSLPALVVGESPNMDAVSTSLKYANEHPAKKLTLRLSSGDTDKVVDAMVNVTEENPWKLTFSVDNAGQSQTGATNASAAIQHANVWGLDHLASLQYATTVEKPNQVRVYGGSYHIPFYTSGDSLDFFGNYSDVDSGFVQSGLLNFGITGKGTVWGARYTKRLGDGKDSEAKLALGLDVKRFKSSVLLSGYELGSEMVVRPLSVNYSDQWSLAQGQLNVSLTMSQNLPGANNGSSEDFAKNRVGATDTFRVFRFALAYTRAFEADTQMRIVLNGQQTGDALVSGEQFGAGGASSVRGFGERTIANDVGATLNAEWYSANYCADGTNWNCRLVGFYDTAYVKRNMALPGELDDAVVSSAGIGARFSLGSRSTVQLDLGHVLRAHDLDNRDAYRLHMRANFVY